MKAADLIKLTDTPLEIDRLRQGTVVMINTNEYGSFNLRIKKESKSDVFGAPQELELELGNLKDDINTTMSDLNRKQQINETYSQGATNILNYSYQDNCESAYPAEIEFYLDDDVFHVNTVELTFKTKRYRGYTKAVKGGGSKTITSEAGGQSTQTSSAGGSYYKGSSTSAGGANVSGGTTQGGGGSSQTSSANGSHRHTVMKYIEDVGKDTSVGSARLYQPLGSDFRVILKSVSMAGDIITASAADNHSHSVNIPSHAHNFNVSIPNHTHQFSIQIPNHTHTVRIPSHKHNVVLPEHTHPLEWGIFQASSSASRVDIIVDGTTLPNHETSQSRLNIVNYLKKTSSGKIQRGNHTIQVKPNGLARIEAQVTCRVFIQSQ